MNRLAASAIDAFLHKHDLPDAFRDVIEGHYLPLARWVYGTRAPPRSPIIGINGAQGTGKSTLADFLRLTLEAEYGWTVAALSLDDFYLTRAQRDALGEAVHPLLRTRGAPGTHDLALCTRCLTQLRSLGIGEALALPRFDKAQDDRAPAHAWPRITGPVDVIILEGWCVGSRPQDPSTLARPVNALEATRDPDASWRTYVNEQLRAGYSDVFGLIDRLVFLRAPDFEAVHRWRLEQEAKLARAAGASSRGVMDETQIAAFIQHYERLTRANLSEMPVIADVTMELDRQHRVTRTRYRLRG
ncbi:MAG: hypothetical protein OXF98_11675 [Rhodospirillaceae bacterium]|nr:hypothetical protein [Rhodospirillaceae bacterium]